MKKTKKSDGAKSKTFFDEVSDLIRLPEETIKVTVSIDPRELEDISLDDTGQLEERFKDNIYGQIVEQWLLCSSKKPRGLNKARSGINNDIKISAGWLDIYFSYLCKKTMKEWAQYDHQTKLLDIICPIRSNRTVNPVLSERILF